MLPRLAFILIFYLYHKFSRSESEAELLNPHVVDGVSAGMSDKDKSVSGQGTTLWQVYALKRQLSEVSGSLGNTSSKNRSLFRRDRLPKVIGRDHFGTSVCHS